MKVLIITYYWPPAGGPGVQRWLKFVKYLRDFNIEPIIFTAKDANYPTKDITLKNDIPDNLEVLSFPIWEPNDILSKFKKKETQKSAGFLNPNPSKLEKILLYIRANFFIPDARKFWIKPSVRYLKKYISKHPVDLVITTGPPHSVHLIGLALKQKLSITWLADFRDPWTSLDYFHLLPLSKSSLKKHQLLEQQVVETADSVLMVSNHAKQRYENLAKSIHVITNGFDTESNINTNISLDSKFSITHIGMMNSERNPKQLWTALHELSLENNAFKDDLELKFIGRIDDSVFNEDLLPKHFKNITRISYVPHKEAKLYQCKSQVLLIVVNDYPSSKEMIPGKTFEYLQAKRPIIAIAPEDGDLAGIIASSKAGETFDFSEKEKLKSYIRNLYRNYKNNQLTINSANIEQYHRKKLTEKLSFIIKDLIQ